MTEHRPLDVGVLYSEGASTYFTNADRRYKTGARYVLDLLGIPLPPTLVKGSPGPNPAKATRELYAREHQQRLPR